MSIGLATDGYCSGGGSDVTAPTIAVVSPNPSLEPGDVGAFSANFAIAKVTPILIDLTDMVPGVTFVFAIDGAGRSIYRRTGFVGEYILGSAQSAIANGVRLTILPDGGWPSGDDPTLDSFVTIGVDAIDGAGNVTSSTFVWELPPAARASYPDTGPSSTTKLGDDHVTEALNRLPQQFR